MFNSSRLLIALILTLIAPGDGLFAQIVAESSIVTFDSPEFIDGSFDTRPITAPGSTLHPTSLEGTTASYIDQSPVVRYKVTVEGHRDGRLSTLHTIENITDVPQLIYATVDFELDPLPSLFLVESETTIDLIDGTTGLSGDGAARLQTVESYLFEANGFRWPREAIVHPLLTAEDAGEPWNGQAIDITYDGLGTNMTRPGGIAEQNIFEVDEWPLWDEKGQWNAFSLGSAFALSPHDTVIIETNITVLVPEPGSAACLLLLSGMCLRRRVGRCVRRDSTHPTARTHPSASARFFPNQYTHP